MVWVCRRRYHADADADRAGGAARGRRWGRRRLLPDKIDNRGWSKGGATVERVDVQTALHTLFVASWDRVTMGAVIVALLLSIYVAYARQTVVKRLEQE